MDAPWHFSGATMKIRRTGPNKRVDFDALGSGTLERIRDALKQHVVPTVAARCRTPGHPTLFLSQPQLHHLRRDRPSSPGHGMASRVENSGEVLRLDLPGGQKMIKTLIIITLSGT
jgi:hypothetical protein